MVNTLSDPNELTISIVLATIPQRQEAKFDKSIRDQFFKKFRNRSSDFCSKSNPSYGFSDLDEKKETPTLYNPIRYYILGNYDIAYISLIDNFKFAHRLFESAPNDDPSGMEKLVSKEENVFSPHTFQSFTGINYHDSKYLKDFFYNNLCAGSLKRKYFLGICNLKVNNGFLIGNGNRFLKAVCDTIKEVIDKYNKSKSVSKKVEFLLLQSFSWFELSLIIFTDDTESIAEILRTLRGISAKDLRDFQTIIDYSLYKSLLTEFKDSDLKMANIFADTHTYIGLHADLINEKSNDDTFTKTFLSKAAKIKLKTDIEWQIKPGHMHLLVNDLKEDNANLKIDFKLKSKYLLTGKTDYILQKSSDSILTNYYLLKMILQEDNKLFDHVRKIRTKVMFKGKVKFSDELNRARFNLNKSLKKLAKNGDDIRIIDEKLKALKISRQIKSKVLKIFSNYNNGIQDIILFPFFLDFKIFIDELFDFIMEEHLKWTNACKMEAGVFFKTTFDSLTSKNKEDEKDLQSVNELEIKLIKRINVFEEGYNLRMLNCYQFEDINDFDLDFNSSVQQLLSAYSSLVIEIGNIFYNQDRKYQFGPVIQLNLKDTQGNYNSINYHVLHLISPEFIFATVTKEILNNEEYDSLSFKPTLDLYNEEVKSFEIQKPYLFEMCNEGLIDFNYFINDSIRFVISYDLDFKLFYYWFWTYNLQNPLLYDKRGIMNEGHFKKELFRIIIIAKYFKVDLKSIYCPLPELFTYWDRHYNRLDEISDTFLTFLEDKKILKPFTEYLIKRFEIYLDILVPLSTSPEFKKDESRAKLQILTETAQRNGAMMCSGKKYFLKEQAYIKFDSGTNSPVDVSLLNLQYHMLTYLKSIYQSNNGVISFLRRDWITGLPLESFIKVNTDTHLYSVDQTGGIFFDNMERLNTYLKQSSCVLSSILHYSMVLKKNFILYKIVHVK